MKPLIPPLRVLVRPEPRLGVVLAAAYCIIFGLFVYAAYFEPRWWWGVPPLIVMAWGGWRRYAALTHRRAVRRIDIDSQGRLHVAFANGEKWRARLTGWVEIGGGFVFRIRIVEPEPEHDARRNPDARWCGRLWKLTDALWRNHLCFARPGDGQRHVWLTRLRQLD